MVRRAALLLSAFALVFCLFGALSGARAIQIIESEQVVAGKKVKHTITIGITSPQLALGLIHGFFVNILLFPFVGPLPEITLFEFDLLTGAVAIGATGEDARFDFDNPIADPMTATAFLDIQFDESTPLFTTATYSISSLDSLGQPIETLTFESELPEPSSVLLLGSGLAGLAVGARRFRGRRPRRRSISCATECAIPGSRMAVWQVSAQERGQVAATLSPLRSTSSGTARMPEPSGGEACGDLARQQMWAERA